MNYWQRDNTVKTTPSKWKAILACVIMLGTSVYVYQEYGRWQSSVSYVFVAKVVVLQPVQ